MVLKHSYKELFRKGEINLTAFYDTLEDLDKRLEEVENAEPTVEEPVGEEEG